MPGAVLERQRDGLLLAVDVQPALARDIHRRLVGRRRIGEKDLVPFTGSIDVARVEHAVGEVLVEDAGLDVAFGTGGDEVERELAKRLVRVGQGGDRLVRGRAGREHGEERDRTHDAKDADAARLEGDELAVGRDPPEAEEDAVEQRHRNRDAERLRKQRDEDAQNPAPGHALRDERGQALHDRRHHQDEGEADERHQKRRHDLADEIPIEDFHLTLVE